MFEYVLRSEETESIRLVNKNIKKKERGCKIEEDAGFELSGSGRPQIVGRKGE